MKKTVFLSIFFILSINLFAQLTDKELAKKQKKFVKDKIKNIESDWLLTLGMRAGLFHPTTGYSLAWSVKTVENLLACHDLKEWPKKHAAFCKKQLSSQTIFFWLNRVMFGAGKPEARYRFLQHFYGLPDKLIHRFYASQMTKRNLFEFFMRKPPIGVAKALRAWGRKEVYGA
jgi:hypothetical protein